MSKQYLTTHTIDDAHPTDIFSLAAVPNAIISASGSSSLRIHATNTPEFELIQTLENAHSLGCHHLAASADGKRFVSVGFEGEVKVWGMEGGSEGPWREEGKVVEGNKAGEIWAIALSSDGQYLAATAQNGRINVWDILAPSRPKIREFETKGSFGLAIDISPDGNLTASGHHSGAIYIFSNATGRLLHSLASLSRPVRTVKFSPAGKLLATAGDSGVVALYDVKSGEQVANLAGHGGAWVFSLDWSSTGEFLLSGAFDGKAKIWNVERRVCVATHTESEKTIWGVKWLPKTGRNELFAVAGAGKSISFYREATGG